MKCVNGLMLALIILLPAALHAEEDWRLVRYHDGIRAYTLFIPGSPVTACKVVCEIDAPLENVKELLLDTRMAGQWYQHLKECRELKRDRDGREILYYFIFEGFWPVADRDLVALVRITRDNGEEFACEMTAVARDSEALVPLSRKYVRVTDSSSTFSLTRAERGRTRLTYRTFTDPSGLVPSFLVNRYMACVPFKALQNMRAFLGARERFCKIEGSTKAQ